MSLLKFIKAQLGMSSTPENNFVLDASAQDGTMKLSRGNAGATTQDVLVVDASGNVLVGGNNLNLFSAKSLAASGYQKMPSGLMLQWGNIVVPVDTNNYTVTFPVAFGAAYQVFVTGTYPGATGGTSMGDVTAGILSATQFVINNDNYGQNVQWLAIGKA